MRVQTYHTKFIFFYIVCTLVKLMTSLIYNISQCTLPCQNYKLLGHTWIFTSIGTTRVLVLKDGWCNPDVIRSQFTLHTIELICVCGGGSESSCRWTRERWLAKLRPVVPITSSWIQKAAEQLPERHSTRERLLGDAAELQSETPAEMAATLCLEFGDFMFEFVKYAEKQHVWVRLCVGDPGGIVDWHSSSLALPITSPWFTCRSSLSLLHNVVYMYICRYVYFTTSTRPHLNEISKHRNSYIEFLKLQPGLLSTMIFPQTRICPVWKSFSLWSIGRQISCCLILTTKHRFLLL